MRLYIEKKNIVFFDGFSFLHMRLSAIPKAMGIPDLCKGFHPYFFYDLNYELFRLYKEILLKNMSSCFLYSSPTNPSHIPLFVGNSNRVSESCDDECPLSSLYTSRNFRFRIKTAGIPVFFNSFKTSECAADGTLKDVGFSAICIKSCSKSC